MPGIASGTPGGHDVNADPMFTGAVPQAPYQIDDGCGVVAQYGVSQMLGYYRALYTPAPGSPLVDPAIPPMARATTSARSAPARQMPPTSSASS